MSPARSVRWVELWHVLLNYVIRLNLVAFSSPRRRSVRAATQRGVNSNNSATCTNSAGGLLRECACFSGVPGAVLLPGADGNNFPSSPVPPPGPGRTAERAGSGVGTGSPAPPRVESCPTAPLSPR